MDKQHKAVMDFIDELEKVQGAGGHWSAHTAIFDEDGEQSGSNPQTTRMGCLMQIFNESPVLPILHWVEDDSQPDDSPLAVVAVTGSSLGASGRQSKAIASAHNTMPAFIAIAKGQLENHYDQWECWRDGGEDEHGDPLDNEHADYYAKLHRTICTQLASIQGDSPKLQALREALNTKEN